MDKLDIFFTIVFIAGTIITMILIYFYNKRHKLIIEDELDDFVVEKKRGEKAIYKSSEKFDWDIYESDLRFNHEKFFGYELWRNREAAEKRIKVLKEAYAKNEHTLKINMLESMLLIDSFGEDITLDNNGIYRIKKIHIDTFIDNLIYDVEMVEKIASLKDELEFSVENYEVDAKKIFYIMKKAKSFGLYNINSHSQVFLFAKRHNNAVIDADIVIEDDNGISELDVIIDDGIAYEEDGDYFEEIEEKEKPDIFAAFKKLKARTKSYIDADGNKIIEYENGQKVIRKNLWEMEAIEEEEEKKENFNKPNKKQSEFTQAITPDPVDKIMEKSNQEVIENIDSHIEKAKLVKTSETQAATIEKVKEISTEKEEEESEIQINNDALKRMRFYDGDNNRIPMLNFLGEINTLEEFEKAVSSLSDRNIKSLMISMLTIDFAQLKLSDDFTTNLIFAADGKFYISHEYMALVLISLVKNRQQFLVDNQIMSANGLLRYPIAIVDIFINILDSQGIDFRVGSQSSFKYLQTHENILLGLSLIELSTGVKNLISTYNSSDKINSVSALPVSKQDFKTSENTKFQINFKDFR